MANADKTTLILAMLLSVFLWAYVRLTVSTPDEVRTLRDIPVTLSGAAASDLLVQLDPGDRLAKITIKGSPEAVANLDAEKIVGRVNIEGLSDSRNTRRRPVRFNLPPGVRLIGITPKVTLSATKLDTRLFPVTVSFLSSPPSGYTVGEYVTEPSTVAVAGSKKALEKIKYVIVAVDPNQRLSTARDLTPRAVDENGSRVDGVSVVSVSTVHVSQASRTGKDITRQVAVSDPKLINLPRRYSVRIDRIEPKVVTVTGAPARLDRLEGFINTDPLDVSGVTNDGYKTVRLQVPDGLEVAGETEVRVHLQVQPLN